MKRLVTVWYFNFGPYGDPKAMSTFEIDILPEAALWFWL
jgi:hypothetical protein